MFLISTLIFWHTLGKIYLPETLWGLEKVPMTFLAEIAACQNWLVVYLWLTTISTRANVLNCILHQRFHFTLPFIIRHHSKKAYNLKSVYPIFWRQLEFVYRKPFWGVPCFKYQCKRKVLVQFTILYANPIQNGRLLILEKWSTLIGYHFSQTYSIKPF